jgi:glutamate synthase domain-containing protein 3
MGMVGLDELAEADAAELRELVEGHLQKTSSPVAQRVLDEWPELLQRGAFVKVMPHDYKRVLRELAQAEAAALAAPPASATGAAAAESA